LTPVSLVNSKRVCLNYELKNVGPSGVSDVELWYTRDGHVWQRHSATRQARPPYVVEVEEEDLYGFTLVAQSGAGLAQRPPQDGDRPQLWVEVDATKPNVRLLGVETGNEAEARHLKIVWRATDRNLGSRPITISCGASPEGPWAPIATKIENSGRYLWPMPPDMPHQFLIRVEAVDMAGNVGVAQTPTPVLSDLAQPTAAILGAEAERR
jgi:hypothetical protein